MISEDTLHTLEFDKILAALGGYSSFSAGRERTDGLRPAVEQEEIQTRLDQVNEARALLDARPQTTIGGARDIRSAAQRAGLGSVLRAEELLSIAGTLEAARDLKGSINKAEMQLPLIREWAGQIQTYPEIVNRINQSVDHNGEVLDSASTRLRQIRSEIRSAHGRLVEKLNSMIASSEYRSALQEPILTVRNGRYVLPVKSDGRSKIPGIVHDQSSSGQTSFVEPLAVTELNNRWAELQIEETREIERILEELSRRVGDQASGILATVEAVADIDCAFARAKYANALQASSPHLNTNGRLSLVRARHPLLRGEVVPITVNLGASFTILVITGPNTGGKTVALKTVGLLTLMAQAGLQIPADEGSTIAVFQHVWADIGDEQSIEQSLSTFSSHMKNIVRILADTDDDSLVLLDELGAGTDPAEGSGLARAVIRELLDLKARAVVTTHYSELKAFAHEQAGVENASVEFDVATLSPTYRLVIGVPGRSQALAIAKRLGLPASILERARSYVSQAGLRVERLLSQIQDERRSIGDLFKRARELHDDLAKLRDRLQDEVERTREEREAVLREARAEGNEAVTQLRQRLAEIEAQASRSGSGKEAARPRSARQAIETARRESLEGLGPDDGGRVTPAPVPIEGTIQVGDEVLVQSLGQTGTVTSKTGGDEVEVQVGHFKLRRSADDLQRLGSGRAQEPKVALRVEGRAQAMPLEIDLRGKRPQEVEPEIERYVNDGYMSGLDTLRIIHGKGTGALRSAIRDQLDAHPLVAGVNSAGKDQGGEGVTVVKLAR